MISQFNIRVYGLLVDSGNRILLCKERYRQMEFVKFPGGGLEFGEGLIDCLKREFMEETGYDVEVGEHFYTTDFFQSSVFDGTQQLISVYYYVKANGFIIPQKSTDMPEFFWKNIDELTVDDFAFPIDKKVASKIIEGRT